jgi:hypothetical protein
MCDIGNSTHCSVAGTGLIQFGDVLIQLKLAGKRRRPDAFTEDHKKETSLIRLGKSSNNASDILELI